MARRRRQEGSLGDWGEGTEEKLSLRPQRLGLAIDQWLSFRDAVRDVGHTLDTVTDIRSYVRARSLFTRGNRDGNIVCET